MYNQQEIEEILTIGVRPSEEDWVEEAYKEQASYEAVNHPTHYNSHPSGVECITIAEHYNFCIGNAIKYLWRAGLKSERGVSLADKEREDCEKAIWYIKRHLCTK